MPSRRSVLGGIAAVAVPALAGCLSDDATLESWAPDPRTWPLDRYDPAGTAHNPHASPPPNPRVAWTATVDTHSTKALAVSETHVAAVGDDRTALLSPAGEVRWQKPVGGETHAWYDGVLYTAGGGGYVGAVAPDGTTLWETTARLDGDGYAVVPTSDGVYVALHGRAGALARESGTVRWERSFRNGIGPNGVCVAGGRLFHTGTGGVAAYEPRVVDAATRHLGPRVAWSVDDAEFSFPSVPTVVDGTLYLGESTSSGEGRVYAYSTTAGVREWRTEPLGQYGGAPVVANGRGFVSVARDAEETGSVVALDLDDGAVAWRRDFPTESWVGDVVVAGGTVLAAVALSAGPDAHRGRVVALDSGTGETRWRVDVDRPVVTLAPVGDRVYVGGDDGFVAALAPT